MNLAICAYNRLTRARRLGDPKVEKSDHIEKSKSNQKRVQGKVGSYDQSVKLG